MDSLGLGERALWRTCVSPRTHLLLQEVKARNARRLLRLSFKAGLRHAFKTYGSGGLTNKRRDRSADDQMTEKRKVFKTNHTPDASSHIVGASTDAHPPTRRRLRSSLSSLGSKLGPPVYRSSTNINNTAAQKSVFSVRCTTPCVCLCARACC